MPHAYCNTCRESKAFKRDIPANCSDCGKPFAMAQPGRMTRCGYCRKPVREVDAHIVNGKTACSGCKDTVKTR